MDLGREDPSENKHYHIILSQSQMFWLISSLWDQWEPFIIMNPPSQPIPSFHSQNYNKNYRAYLVC